MGELEGLIGHVTAVNNLFEGECNCGVIKICGQITDSQVISATLCLNNNEVGTIITDGIFIGIIEYDEHSILQSLTCKAHTINGYQEVCLSILDRKDEDYSGFFKNNMKG